MVLVPACRHASESGPTDWRSLGIYATYALTIVSHCIITELVDSLRTSDRKNLLKYLIISPVGSAESENHKMSSTYMTRMTTKPSRFHMYSVGSGTYCSYPYSRGKVSRSRYFSLGA